MVTEAWLQSEIDDDCIIHDLLYVVLVIHFIMCQDLALLLVVELVKFHDKKKHATMSLVRNTGNNQGTVGQIEMRE